MAKKIIDMSQSPRAGQFAYFSAMADPWAGATVMVDITDFLPAIREKGLPFFLSFLFAVSRAGNAVPELRRRLLPDGTVVEYDLCQPSYTAMKPDGAYVYVDVDGGIADLRAFCAQGKANQAAAIEKGVLAEGGRRPGSLLHLQRPLAPLRADQASRRHAGGQPSPDLLGPVPGGERPGPDPCDPLCPPRLGGRAAHFPLF